MCINNWVCILEKILIGQLATAIDAEGSLSIVRARKTPYANYRPQIQLTNKSKEWLEYFQNKVNGFWRIQSVKWKNRTYYRLTMRDRKCLLESLKEILPYLIIKRERAILIIEFCESRNSHQKSAYTERELEIRKQVFLMNITGRGHLKQYEKDVMMRTRHEGWKLRERDSKGHFKGNLHCG